MSLRDLAKARELSAQLEGRLRPDSIPPDTEDSNSELGLFDGAKNLINKIRGKDKKKDGEKDEGGNPEWNEKLHPRGPDGKFAEAPNQKSKGTVKPFWPGDLERAKKDSGNISGQIKKLKEYSYDEMRKYRDDYFGDYDLKDLKIKEIKTGKLKNVFVNGVYLEPGGKSFTAKTKSGKTVGIYDADKNKVSDDDKKMLLKTLVAMHNLYPESKTNKILLKSDNDAGFLTARIKGGASGYVLPLPGLRDRMYLNSRYFSGSNADDKDRLNEVVRHEFGHTHDVEKHGARSLANPGGKKKKLFKDPFIRKEMTDYGLTDKDEAYAEMFAKWHGSKGDKGFNKSATAYAVAFKWKGWELPEPKSPYRKYTGYANEGVEELAPTTKSPGINLTVTALYQDALSAAKGTFATAPEDPEVAKNKAKDQPPMDVVIIDTFDPKTGPIRIGLDSSEKEEPLSAAEEAKIDKIIKEVFGSK